MRSLLLFFVALSINSTAQAVEIQVPSNNTSIMSFLMANPAAQNIPLSIQLTYGVVVKVISISYSQCAQGSETSMSIQAVDSQEKKIINVKNISIPCPK
ncbi:MAG: hypothetical protein SGI74_12530 [Oligoflexia bacterium]|nr:hypothetical protein [Oligoflexia bacterium]